MEKIKKVIVTFYLTILTFFSGNCKFLSHNSEGEKSQNCEIKSRSNLFLFLYSVAEMGFHRSTSNVMKQII